MRDLNLMSPREAAQALGIGLTTFYEEVRPHIAVVRIGRRVLVDGADLAAWVESHKETGGVQGAQTIRA